MPKDQDHNPDRYTMSFGDHLEELRRRLLLCLVVPLPLAVLIFLVSSTLIEWLVLPLYRALDAQGLEPRVQVLSPAETIITEMKLAFIAAIVLSAPWILWQGWLFISPGLYRHERRFVRLLIPGSAVLTLAGTALLYFVMLPLMLHVLIGFGTALDMSLERPPPDPRVAQVLESVEQVPIRLETPAELRPGEAWLHWPDMRLWVSAAGEQGAVEVIEVPRPVRAGISQEFRVSTYISFVLMLLLGISVAFQMPLVIVLLGWLGLVSAPWLRAKRRWAMFICGIVSAMITPADMVSMLMMLVPLYALYELGILLLVIAPASAVAEGRVLRTGWRLRTAADGGAPDKRTSETEQPTEPLQSESSIAREDRRGQPPEKPSDGGSGE